MERGIAVTAGINIYNILNQGGQNQSTGGEGGVASCPWLIPAGKLVSAHRAQRPPTLQRVWPL